jgi:hypothetical protein
MSAQQIYVDHLDLSRQPQTFISTDYASGTSLVVKNTYGFNANDYLLFGKLGFEQSEIGQISSVTNGTTIVLQNALNFPHASDTTVTKIPYNQVKFYRSTTGIGGSYTLLSTVNIAVDQPNTFYYDTTGNSTYSYKVSYYNSTTAVESMSAEITSASLPDYALQTIQDNTLSLFGDKEERFISRDEITVWVNEYLNDCQMVLTGGESPNFISNFIITATASTSTSSASYSMSAYNVLSILFIDVSTDGGVNFTDSITPKDFRLHDVPGIVSQYDYRVESDNIIINPAPRAGTVIRVWYTTLPVALTAPTDLLPLPMRVLTRYFVDYCMMRGNEKDRKVSELSVNYGSRAMSLLDIRNQNSLLYKMRRKIKQGNMMMATTFADDYAG